MNNVVSLSTYRKAPKIELPEVNQLPVPVLDFISYLYDWAHDNGVDTQSLDFKYSAATITSVLQGMLACR